MSINLHHAVQPIAHNRSELTQFLNLQSNATHERLGQYLLRKHLVSAEILREAMQSLHHNGGKKLGEVLIEMGALEESALNQALLSQLEIPTLVLDKFALDPLAINLLPAEIAQRYQALPVMLHADSLVLASATLLSQQANEFIRFICQKKIINVVADGQAIRLALNENYLIEEQNNDLQQFERALRLDDHNQDQDQQASQDTEFMAKQQPIVKLVETILQTAVLRNASDIHIRPEADHFDLLYRIDGSLQKLKDYPKSLLPAVVGRIKILARLNIAERRLPQDGRIGYQYEKNRIDLRISIIPVQYGESIVIRVLNKNQGLRTIDQIGFATQDEARFHDLLNRSHGIILVTGPTGSGKSTTLYAALQEVVKSNVNIITVEDPIEYELNGTRQIQLIPTINFSFPQALRHILRHDPDVIMIGEMRDVETCKIALESALTGHLVFSTLHTNDAASSIVRLLEIGVEAYMIRASVIGILAQRLVRKNCPHCLQLEVVTPLMRQNLDLPDDEEFYQGCGCEHCHQTGFSGRLAIYELMIVNDAIREFIQAGMSADGLTRLAIQEGMTKISESALVQARLKNTSIAEIYRACM